MRQKAYSKVADLIDAGTNLKAGATAHAVSLGLVVGTTVAIEADLNALTTATEAHLSGLSTLRTLRETLEAKTAEAYAVAVIIRDSLKRSFGYSYSASWQGTGFSGSLYIKRSMNGLKQTLLSLKSYLKDHPEKEVTDVATAAIAGAALDALTAAKAAVTVQTGAVRTLISTRKQMEKAMKRRISHVVDELERVIGPLDGRWEAFGLNQPGIKQAPEAPGNVTVVLVGNSAASVKWTKGARAEYYRVWLKIVGTDTEANPVGTPSDLDFTIENLPPNAQLEVAVSAMNNGGESPRTPVVLAQTLPVN